MAVWRAAQIVTSENDLFGIIKRLRDHFGIWQDGEGKFYYEPTENPLRRNFCELLTCIRCLSVWLGFFFAILYSVRRSFSILIAMPFALSAAALMLQAMWEDDESIDSDPNTT